MADGTPIIGSPGPEGGMPEGAKREGRRLKISDDGPFGADETGVSHSKSGSETESDAPSSHDETPRKKSAKSNREGVSSEGKKGHDAGRVLRKNDESEDTAAESDDAEDEPSESLFERLAKEGAISESEDDEGSGDEDEKYKEPKSKNPKTNERFRKLANENRELSRTVETTNQAMQQTQQYMQQMMGQFQAMQQQNAELRGRLDAMGQRVNQPPSSLKPGDEGYELDLLTRGIREKLSPEVQQQIAPLMQGYKDLATKFSQFQNQQVQEKRAAQTRQVSVEYQNKAREAGLKTILREVDDPAIQGELGEELQQMVLARAYSMNTSDFGAAASATRSAILKVAAALERAHGKKVTQKVNNPKKPPAPLPQAGSQSGNPQGKSQTGWPTWNELKADGRYKNYVQWQQAGSPVLKPRKG